MYEKLRDNWHRLTHAEKKYLAQHPIHAAVIEKNALTALAEAKHRFGAGSLHNGDGDAFRHCYWSALMSRDLGYDNAKTFVSAHENFTGNPVREKEMDMHNNHEGLILGATWPRKNLELATLCYEYLLKGKLRRKLR